MEGLSAEAARLIAIRAQGLSSDSARTDVPHLLRRLGAVQLDTISVLARSHELVAYSRLGAVGRTAVEEAYWGSADTFEYYAHAACVLPAEDWPYFAFRRRAFRARPIAQVPQQTLAEVRARLREAPVTATDLGGARGGGGWWDWSAAKLALEVLYVRGEAVVTSRKGWKRVYDLAERAISARYLDQEPSDQECFAYLLASAGRALGVATKRDLADYYRLKMTQVELGLEASGLVPVRVQGWDEATFAAPEDLDSLAGRVEHRTTLLSPFDSLVWDRRRTQRLFDFTFSLEAYLPKEKRTHGYFAMPLLTDGRLAGRVDPKREGRMLVARRVSIDRPDDIKAMASALRDAAAWVNCDTVRVDVVDPPELAPPLRKSLETE